MTARALLSLEYVTLFFLIPLAFGCYLFTIGLGGYFYAGAIPRCAIPR